MEENVIERIRRYVINGIREIIKEALYEGLKDKKAKRRELYLRRYWRRGERMKKRK